MNVLVMVLILIVCFLLTIVVLAQNSKGGGLSSQFGGSSTSNLIGVKRTTDLLEKITWTLSIVLLVLSLTATIMVSQNASTGEYTSPNIEAAGSQAPGGDLNLDLGTEAPTTQGPESTEDAPAQQQQNNEALENLLGTEEESE